MFVYIISLSICIFESGMHAKICRNGTFILNQKNTLFQRKSKLVFITFAVRDAAFDFSLCHSLTISASVKCYLCFCARLCSLLTVLMITLPAHLSPKSTTCYEGFCLFSLCVLFCLSLCISLSFFLPLPLFSSLLLFSLRSHLFLPLFLVSSFSAGIKNVHNLK